MMCQAIGSAGHFRMRAIIISISSDIGAALGQHWIKKGWEVAGTYRTESAEVERLKAAGAEMAQADFARPDSIDTACARLGGKENEWDVLVICPASQKPVGLFEETDFDEWDFSIKLNFVNLMRCLKAFLPSRRSGQGATPTVITWAGGGTNGATTRCSAYTVSKIAQIKMMELLDAELPDVKLTNLGPGWVRTKIHGEVLEAGSRAGENLSRTRDHIESGEWTPMESVLWCCDWVVAQPKEIVSGRNFSIAHDSWGESQLEDQLKNDSNMYKLRRSGNNWEYYGK